MNLIILASGMGKRLGVITKNKPKCLIKIYKDKSLIDYISNCFYLFKKVIIVTGYKSQLIKKHLKNKNLFFVVNKNYKNTNMVESFILAAQKIKKNDTIILYADIFFDPNILRSIISKKGNLIPVNKNWLISWKKR